MPDKSMTHDDRKRFRINVAQLGAYLMIVSLAFIGFLDIEYTQAELCEESAVNREAIRSVVRAVDDLGVALILDGDRKETASPEELEAIRLLDKFRHQQLKSLDIPVCTSMIGGR